MKIILVEFVWQVDEILGKNLDLKNTLIVSLDPESSYNLKSNKISYVEIEDICSNKYIWDQYEKITDHTFKITNILNEALWKCDERFKNLNWKFFDDFHYPIKIIFDQLYLYAEIISKLIKKYDPEEILIAESSTIYINEHFQMGENQSVLKYLLKDLQKKTEIKFMFPSNKIVEKTFHVLPFGQPRYLMSLNNIKTKIKKIYFKTKFLSKYYLYKTKYLSIGCSEINRMIFLNPKFGKNYLSYYHENLNYKYNKKNKEIFEKIKYFLNKKTQYPHLIQHNNINFSEIFDAVLEKYSRFLNLYVHEFYKAKEIVEKKKPRCVIFQSMTPFYSPNVTFRKVCNDLKIPYATWVHGGYCTYSLPGYDIVDFKLCKNHISYGQYLVDLVKSDKCVLKRLNLNKDQKVFPVGSFRFDYNNRKKKPKGNKNKPTIIFALGSLQIRNQFYFGYNRKDTVSHLWMLNYEILLLLKKYQDKYNIIVKDYPTGNSNLWKKILKDIDANKIKYISKEHSLSDLLFSSDLNIFPWIGTTFFEALYSKADLFVLDDDIFEEPFKNKFNQEIFWGNDKEKFKYELKKYLDEGKFYNRTKEESKKYFLNLSTSKERTLELEQSLNQIA